MLSATELLDTAAACRDRSSVDTGVYIATLAVPGLSLDEAAHLPIGVRDTALARFYTAMFGDRLEFATNCPECGVRLDVGLPADTLCLEPAPEATALVEIGGRRFEVRPLNSIDLAVIAELPDPETGRVQLALRCLVPLTGAGVPEALLDDQIDAVAAALAVIDPRSDFYVPLTCLECETSWKAPVDVAGALTIEIDAAADTLLDDVHELALAYHWSESAILALPPTRRRAYLERLGR
jgi:hypothetical protein